MTLSSIDIEKFLNHHNSFMGCYPCNKLPPFPKRLPKSLIVNTDDNHESGDHWVALIFTKSNAFYFDSFGIGILENDILKYIGQGYNSYIHSVKEIQDVYSEKCGHFCMGFVLKVESIETYDTYLKQFDSRAKMKNDLKIEKVLKKVEIMVTKGT